MYLYICPLDGYRLTFTKKISVSAIYYTSSVL